MIGPESQEIFSSTLYFDIRRRAGGGGGGGEERGERGGGRWPQKGGGERRKGINFQSTHLSAITCIVYRCFCTYRKNMPSKRRGKKNINKRKGKVKS